MNVERQALEVNSLIEATSLGIRANGSPQLGLPHLTAVTSEFAAHFGENDCQPIASVPITAKLDPSVRFIGAPISVLKPLFLEQEIPPGGAFMVQNCVRTRGVRALFESGQVPKYGSFFTGLCVLVEYPKLGELGGEAKSFLQGRLGVDADDICINVNEGDEDLVAVAEGLGLSNVYANAKPAPYYRHKYGLDTVWGRNFNFGLRSLADGEFEDIGNLIVIENQDGPLGVELALGDTTMLKQIYGLGHILDSYGLELVPPNAPEGARRRLEDSAITCLALFREGLRPGGSNNQTRLLRSYVKALSFYRQLLSINLGELQDRLAGLEMNALPFEAPGQAAAIVGRVDGFEKQLLTNGPQNKEDHAIIEGLKT